MLNFSELATATHSSAVAIRPWRRPASKVSALGVFDEEDGLHIEVVHIAEYSSVPNQHWRPACGPDCVDYRLNGLDDEIRRFANNIDPRKRNGKSKLPFIPQSI